MLISQLRTVSLFSEQKTNKRWSLTEQLHKHTAQRREPAYQVKIQQTELSEDNSLSMWGTCSAKWAICCLSVKAGGEQGFCWCPEVFSPRVLAARRWVLLTVCLCVIGNFQQSIKARTAVSCKKWTFWNWKCGRYWQHLAIWLLLSWRDIKRKCFLGNLVEKWKV